MNNVILLAERPSMRTQRAFALPDIPRAPRPPRIELSVFTPPTTQSFLSAPLYACVGDFLLMCKGVSHLPLQKLQLHPAGIRREPRWGLHEITRHFTAALLTFWTFPGTAPSCLISWALSVTLSAMLSLFRGSAAGSLWTLDQRQAPPTLFLWCIISLHLHSGHHTHCRGTLQSTGAPLKRCQLFNHGEALGKRNRSARCYQGRDLGG